VTTRQSTSAAYTGSRAKVGSNGVSSFCKQHSHIGNQIDLQGLPALRHGKSVRDKGRMAPVQSCRERHSSRSPSALQRPRACHPHHEQCTAHNCWIVTSKCTGLSCAQARDLVILVVHHTDRLELASPVTSKDIWCKKRAETQKATGCRSPSSLHVKAKSADSTK